MDNKNREEAERIKRRATRWMKGFVIFLIVGILDILLLFIVQPKSYRNNTTQLVFMIIFIICCFACPVCFAVSKQLERKSKVAAGFYDSVEDVIRAEEQTRREQDAIIEARRAVTRQEQAKREEEIKAAQHPECPACHGKNTQRISTTKRVVSTSLVGLASSTIGKQYECLDCKHKW